MKGIYIYIYIYIYLLRASTKYRYHVGVIWILLFWSLCGFPLPHWDTIGEFVFHLMGFDVLRTKQTGTNFNPG